MPVSATCPGCGAQVQFRLDASFLVVCEFCNALVVRGDRTVEQIGKVADLVETRSPLRLWLRGNFGGAGFVLSGRAQLRHPMGGVWDEWYLAFDDGTWGWLAEHQGRFVLTFEQPPGTPVPPLAGLRPGAQVKGKGTRLTVAEVSEGTYVAATGELPFKLIPGRTFPFADLAGPSGEFATFDYGEDPPRAFLGRQIEISDLGIAPADLVPREIESPLGGGPRGTRLACPNCNGNLELRAPDETQRVGCPFCGALLDVNQGQLAFLTLLSRPSLALELGTEIPIKALPALAAFEGSKEGVGTFQVIGYMQRSTQVDGIRYSWDEYLAYQPLIGFRWLVCAQGHWSWVKPISVGAVQTSGKSAAHDKLRYRLFQQGDARVDQVVGEIYWKVEAGETTHTQDYVKAPFMLSSERSDTEVNWSLGHYVSTADLAKAIGKKELVERFPAVGVGPNQPFPHRPAYRTFKRGLLAAVLLGIVMTIVISEREVAKQEFALEPQVAENTQVAFSDAFDIAPGRNVVVEVGVPQMTSFIVVRADLVNEMTGEVREFILTKDDGGAFDGRHVMSAMGAMSGVVRLEVLRGANSTAGPLTLKVSQGAAGGFNLLALLCVLLGGWMIILWRHYAFEAARWSESSETPFWLRQNESED